MKDAAIFSVGFCLIAPCVLMVLSGDILVTLVGAAYGVALWKSGKTKIGHCFWRKWHRINYRLTSIFG